MPVTIQQHNSRQQGFVLVLALVMLAVLTLIGVSSMNTANMELKATGNAKQHQVAFNAVQSLIEYAVSDTGATPPLVDYQITDTTTEQTVTAKVPNASKLSAKVKLTGCGIGAGSSMEEGKGFNFNFFTINATGSNEKGTATSVQSQGVRFPTAAC